MENAYDNALNILKQIRSAGFTATFAGRAVRDKLLGRTPKDYDIATNALPEQIEELFEKTVAVGKAFGVIMVVQNNIETEVATFREDAGYQDGRRPDSVTFCGAEEDAKRRDFTVNGMFYDPIKDEVIDYVGGKVDLEKKIIRAIGDPERRFAEDHLRMLRAVRFAHTLGFTIDPFAVHAMQFEFQIKRFRPHQLAQGRFIHFRHIFEAHVPGNGDDDSFDLFGRQFEPS